MLHGFATPRRYRVTVEAGGGDPVVFETSERSVPLEEAIASLGIPAVDDIEARLVQVSLRSAISEAGRWSPETRVTVYLTPSGALRIAAIQRDA